MIVAGDDEREEQIEQQQQKQKLMRKFEQDLKSRGILFVFLILLYYSDFSYHII